MSQPFPNTADGIEELYNVISDPNRFHLQDICKDKIGCTTICFAIQNATPNQLVCNNNYFSKKIFGYNSRF